MKKTLIVAASIVALTALNASAADAQANWDKHCAKCHGKDGKGDTRMGKKFDLKDYSDASVQAKFTDEEATKAIKEGIKEDGHTRMKPYANVLSDDEIKELVAHVRGFKK